MRFEESITKTKNTSKKYSKVKISCSAEYTEIMTRDRSNPSLFKSEQKRIVKENLSIPTTIEWDRKNIELLSNFCTNPFCENSGRVSDPYLFRKPKDEEYYGFYFSGSADSSIVKCPTCNKHITISSDVAFAIELKKLIDCKTLTNRNSIYNRRNFISKESVIYHHDNCEFIQYTPKDGSKYFRNKGKQRPELKGIRYKCKSCGKTTTINPLFVNNITRGFKNHHKLVPITQDLVHEVPLGKIARKNETDMSTLYTYITHIYERFLYFKNKKEDNFFESHIFEYLNLASDFLVIFTNNQRQKYHPSSVNQNTILPLNTFVTACNNTGYILSADMCYDYTITADEVYDSITRTNGLFISPSYTEFDRYNFSIYKSGSLQYDNILKRRKLITTEKTDLFYSNEKQRRHFLINLGHRRHYQKGMHIKERYVVLSQYKYLKEKLNYKVLNINSDGGKSIKSGLLKIFSDEVKEKRCFYISHVRRSSDDSGQEDYSNETFRSLSKNVATKFNEQLELVNTQRELSDEVLSYKKQMIVDLNSHFRNGEISSEDYVFESDRLEEFPDYHYSIEFLKNHFSKDTVPKEPIKLKHPYPTGNNNNTEITLETDFSELTIDEIAKKVTFSNCNSIDRFFNILRRSVQIYERPMHSSKSHNSNYSYAPMNIRYADYILQIFTIYYNYCDPIVRNGKKVSRAQSMGIVNRLYTIQEIISGK